MEEGTAKNANAVGELCEEISRLCKDIIKEHRLQLSAETPLTTIGSVATTTRPPFPRGGTNKHTCSIVNLPWNYC